MFTFHNLPKVVTKSTKRVGRGPGSQRGKNAGKGHKGQTKHGGPVRIGFEGGQKSLLRRLPKFKGFNPLPDKQEVELNLAKIDRAFSDGELISISSLKEKNLIHQKAKRVRIVNSGVLTKKITFEEDNGIYLTKGVRAVITK